MIGESRRSPLTYSIHIVRPKFQEHDVVVLYAIVYSPEIRHSKSPFAMLYLFITEPLRYSIYPLCQRFYQRTSQPIVLAKPLQRSLKPLTTLERNWLLSRVRVVPDAEISLKLKLNASL